MTRYISSAAIVTMAVAALVVVGNWYFAPSICEGEKIADSARDHFCVWAKDIVPFKDACRILDGTISYPEIKEEEKGQIEDLRYMWSELFQKSGVRFSKIKEGQTTDRYECRAIISFEFEDGSPESAKFAKSYSLRFDEGGNVIIDWR